MRDRSVVTSSVIPSAKYCWSGSLLRLANGRTTMERRGATRGCVSEVASAATAAGGAEEDCVAGQSHQPITAMTSIAATPARRYWRNHAAPATRHRDRHTSHRQFGAGFAQRKDPHRPCYILDALLAPVLERVREFVSDLIAHHSRDANAPGFCQCLQPRSNVDTVAVDVVLLGNYVTNVDADAEPNPAFFWHVGLALGHAGLHLDRAAHCIHNTGKFRHQAVAGVLYGAAMVLPDLRINHFAQMRLEPFVRPLLVGSHQPRVPGHIGGENGGETAGRGHRWGKPLWIEKIALKDTTTRPQRVHAARRRPAAVPRLSRRSPRPSPARNH